MTQDKSQMPTDYDALVGQAQTTLSNVDALIGSVQAEEDATQALLLEQRGDIEQARASIDVLTQQVANLHARVAGQDAMLQGMRNQLAMLEASVGRAPLMDPSDRGYNDNDPTA